MGEKHSKKKSLKIELNLKEISKTHLYLNKTKTSERNVVVDLSGRDEAFLTLWIYKNRKTFITTEHFS